MWRGFAAALLVCSTAWPLDLNRAHVRRDGQGRAAEVLVSEIQRRTGIALAQDGQGTGIDLRVSSRIPHDGFTIESNSARVLVEGGSARGLLFGVGRLLRELNLAPARIELVHDLHLSSAPKYLLRGHQLGYRPKTNSYDGWTVAMWDQYIRELALWGTNAIELMPPRTDDDRDSPHFPLPPMRMMIEMSRIVASYGLDVWIWYPALDADYTDPATVDFALNEWAEVFRKLPRVDAVMTPGGDPGRTRPRTLLALLKRQTENLHKYHPQATMWVSAQSFSQEWLDEFFELLREEPAWLAGVVYGPETRIPLAEFRRRVPKRYPIRNYPDITHTTHAQFVVPDWDPAFALTSGREPINPRPEAMATIFQLQGRDTIGAITYSEGCNDDVNKFVWSALGWDPNRKPADIAGEYARFFFGGPRAQVYAEGLLGLEKNWRGPLADNPQIERTLSLFERATDAERKNWRLQMAIYRANYDAYVKQRLVAERDGERRALNALQRGELDEAERELRPSAVAPELRARVFALAEDLYQSARMQLSVEKYKAIGRERGATLDGIDSDLNNRGWLLERIAKIRKLAPSQREDAIRAVLHWTDPGPGGFYDDLGDPRNQPHLVRGPVADDPPHFSSAFTGVVRRPWEYPAWRLSWITEAETMFDAPLEMRYSGLSPTARYRLRIIYGGESGATRIQRLGANGNVELHPFQRIERRTDPVEFDIPATATAGSALELVWARQPGLPGAGRGNQVAEVWLIRVTQ